MVGGLSYATANNGQQAAGITLALCHPMQENVLGEAIYFEMFAKRVFDPTCR